MKSRSEIWLTALEELGAECSVSTWRDAETLTSRVEHEGDTFFKVTLPLFAKELERCLALEHIPQDAFRGFKRRLIHIDIVDEFGQTMRRNVVGRHGNPQFLGGFMDLVFNDKVVITKAEYHALEKSLRDSGRQAEFSWHDDMCPEIVDDTCFTPEACLRAAQGIQAIRQLCLMFSKEKELCSQPRIDEAVTAFVKTDEELVLPFRRRKS